MFHPVLEPKLQYADIGRPDLVRAHIAANMTEEEMDLYRAPHIEKFFGIMDGILRYHLFRKVRILAQRKWHRSVKLGTPLTYLEKLPSYLKDVYDLHQLLAKGEFFKHFASVGIPAEPNFIDTMADNECSKSTLGDLVWYYESAMLQAYAPINMSHRYRGMPRTCNSIKTINFINSKLMSHEEENARNEQRVKERVEDQRKNMFSYMQRVAKSKHHYHFLRSLGKAQLVTIPISILRTAMEDIFPYFEDCYVEYARNFGKENKKVLEVLAKRGKLEKKLKQYQTM